MPKSLPPLRGQQGQSPFPRLRRQQCQSPFRRWGDSNTKVPSPAEGTAMPKSLPPGWGKVRMGAPGKPRHETSRTPNVRPINQTHPSSPQGRLSLTLCPPAQPERSKAESKAPRWGRARVGALGYTTVRDLRTLVRWLGGEPVPRKFLHPQTPHPPGKNHRNGRK